MSSSTIVELPSARQGRPAAQVKPLHLVISSLLIRSLADRFLMVQTYDRMGQGLKLPGGIMELDETPTACARRETQEGLGLELEIGALLSVGYRAEDFRVAAGLHFIFGAQKLLWEDTVMRLRSEDIATWKWIPRCEVVQRHVPEGRGLVAAAMAGLDTGAPVYLG